MNGTHPDLNAYLDDALNARQREAVVAHLASCAVCQKQLQEWQALRRMLREVPAPAPRLTPQVFAARLQQRLPTTRPQRRSGPVLAPLAFVFLGWSFFSTLFYVLDGLLSFGPIAYLLPDMQRLWVVQLLRPLLELPIMQMMTRILSLGGWLGWDEWAFLFFSLSWAVISAGLLALDWAWTHHRSQLSNP